MQTPSPPPSSAECPRDEKGRPPFLTLVPEEQGAGVEDGAVRSQPAKAPPLTAFARPFCKASPMIVALSSLLIVENSQW